MRQLEQQWQTLHAASIRSLRRHAATAPDPVTTALPGVSPGLLAGLSHAEAREATQRGAHFPELLRLVDEHAEVLGRMHAAVFEARVAMGTLPLEEAADRGPHGLRLSPADRCAAMAAPLRAYEAELQMKQACLHALRPGAQVSAQQAQTLVVAWESQPLLEHAESSRAAADAQEQLEARLAAIEGRTAA